ncbi:ATP dependent DNA ligase [Nonomuraea recticatena]|uniref:ATP dependent DNA ligase n=1 Tax=Nonomuraea recticatena TaxID=46178 RepID=UPI003616F525
MGARAARGQAVQPSPGRARPRQRLVRDARQDVQGADRRVARLADPALPRDRRRPTDEWTVTLRPELVVEIAFDGVQRSPRYPGGMALRFARVLRYRPDKRADEADTVETVRSLMF